MDGFIADRQRLNAVIVEKGRALIEAVGRQRPSIFEQRRWAGRMISWVIEDAAFRTAMLRFIDVFPTLSEPASVARHLIEYFDEGKVRAPGPLHFALKAAASGGHAGVALLAAAIRYSIEKLGRQFIVSRDEKGAFAGLTTVRREGCAFSVDPLGETVISEDEAAVYASRCMALIDRLDAGRRYWRPLGKPSFGLDLDWGYAPLIAVSLKPSALYSQARPQDFDGSVEAMAARLRPIYERVIKSGGSLCIDMESHELKNMFIELYKRLRVAYPAYPYLSIAIQSYLTETDGDIERLLAWSREESLPVSIRLVKGAYWDYEVMKAAQNGWTPPVRVDKADTDAAFERHAALILANHDTAFLGCGSHNIRSIAAVIAIAESAGVSGDRYEFQLLYGMAEPIRKTLVEAGRRVRLYCPYGSMVPGMAYLVRRLLENTANQGFLRLMFAKGEDAAALLQDPLERMSGGEAAQRRLWVQGPPGEDGFINAPAVDFSKEEERARFSAAVSEVRRRQAGAACDLFIDGSDRRTKDLIPSTNPADPAEIIAQVSQAGKGDAAAAIDAAGAAFGKWRKTPPEARAAYLLKAADWMCGQRYELAACQVLEIGKQWWEAHADVAEAIDFLRYYAQEMIRIGAPRRLSSPPGEVNLSWYEPRGVSVVIAPWNFPLAISTGMVAAAIVTGNCVVYKPSPLTPAVGRRLVEAFRSADLPAGVLNFVPGRTEVIAEYLVDHPAVSTVAFTGSTKVGLSIIERTAVASDGQANVKRVICEMGGKNAIIIDEDADLDEAVPEVLASAFGFQGQKCSSCSRVIVLESIYEGFVERLVKAADSLAVGPAEDPAFFLGPVCDANARARIMGYIEIAREEGKVLYTGRVPPGDNYVPVTIVGDIRPEHRVAQEEIFGPVLAVMKVKSFEEAIIWANSTRFALTGGVFSRSPRRLDEARKNFMVGNLYLNRRITGALVGRQPFGGFRMSGLGTKAGGEEYLLHFMDPRVSTENTARRGFAPEIGQ